MAKNKIGAAASFFRRAVPIVVWTMLPTSAFALGKDPYVQTTPIPDGFALVRAQHAAAIVIDSAEYSGVVRAAHDLQSDVQRVTGCTPTFAPNGMTLPAAPILLGTIGHSRLIDRLIREKKLNTTGVADKWESFVIQTVPHPLPGVEKALVIAGSDRRGTIYGIYDLSEQIGVSPWYWWADVPVRHQDVLYVKPGRYVEGEPAVKYRGIFINDEAPSMSGWAQEKFGGFRSKMYAHVFELILRLKANYLWPAMWGKSLWEDDPESSKLAQEFGVVLGTSHHEPMLRAQADWHAHGTGPWDYVKNGDELRKFWTEGVRRSKDDETITTIGMRGDGDMPMMNDADAAAKLMESIVADQRKIIAQEVNPNPAAVPQLWALYKEVQEYYEKGMRVPDDVTLLWCDDNWGNLRRLPTPQEQKRGGGAGIYYHLDYVGGPRSYKWLNTVPITKVWEQMHLAHEYKANRIWIVNVGDLKPMEFPIEFFLDYAREPDRWPQEKIGEFTRLWAAREFGPAYAPQIADLVSKYTKYNGRRKPELLAPNTFSLVNYGEADRIVADWKAIANEADQINSKLPAEDRDAFFELVLYPVKACATVNELYVAVGKNHLYAQQGRQAEANDCAAEARRLFQDDADLAATYNRQIAGGKWDHMMDQTHIGYTSWSDPRTNIMPRLDEKQVPVQGTLGAAVEGSTQAWPAASGSSDPAPSLPSFDSVGQQLRYVDVFSRGQSPADFVVTPNAPWINVSATSGSVTKSQRFWVSVDWKKAPAGTAEGSLTIAPPAGSLPLATPITIGVKAIRPEIPISAAVDSFVETNGYVSIEAAHYTSRRDADGVGWRRIDDYGRTGASMTIFPVTAPSRASATAKSPCLEYRVFLFGKAAIDVSAIIAPSLDFMPGHPLRFAVSFDDQAPRTINVPDQKATRDWENAVRDNAFKLSSHYETLEPGLHTFKVWMIDPGVVLQKIVLDLGGVRPSYLGPPESKSAELRPDPLSRIHH